MGADYYEYISFKVIYDKNIKNNYEQIIKDFKSKYPYIDSYYCGENKIMIISKQKACYDLSDEFTDLKLPDSYSELLNEIIQDLNIFFKK